MSASLWYFFGIEHTLIFWSTVIIYKKFTESTIRYRSSHIMESKKHDRLSDAYLSETLANFYNIKYFNADEFCKKTYENHL